MSEKLTLSVASADDTPLFYSTQDAERDKEIGCLGYLRADFGRDGNEFWSTWTDACSELKTQAFKTEFDGVINGLRKSGMLKDRRAMSAHCHANPQARLGGERENYGFKVVTQNHVYCLRCQPNAGDYNLYCYAYERGRLEKCFPPPPQAEKKPSLLAALDENNQRAAAQRGKAAAPTKSNEPEV